MRQSEDVKEINTALAKAQGEYGKLEKSGFNKHLQYHYSTIADMINATKDALANNGLSVNQFIKTLRDEIGVETHLNHSSGQYKISDELKYYLPANKALNIQELGSLITYLTKYDYRTVTGIHCDEDDDDGEGAKEGNGKQQEKTKTQAKKEEPKKNTPPTQAPPAAPPAKTEEKKKEEKPDSNKKERVQALWNRTKTFYSADEFAKVVKEKWGQAKLMELSDTQMSEWASYIGGLEVKKLNEQREKEPATTTQPPPSTSTPPSTHTEAENSKNPWSMARPDQITKIEELLTEINWDKERKVQWWETYRKSHKIETTAMVDLTNTQASSLIVYLENKLREVRLDASTSPPPSIDPAEEEARKINEENQRLAQEDKVPF